VRLAGEHERRPAQRIEEGLVERYLGERVALDGSPKVG
jgi:hypothetical protein